jgi:hypothetical protein
VGDFLSDLAARASGRAPALRPRPPSRFAQAGSHPISPWPGWQALEEEGSASGTGGDSFGPLVLRPFGESSATLTVGRGGLPPAPAPRGRGIERSAPRIRRRQADPQPADTHAAAPDQPGPADEAEPARLAEPADRAGASDRPRPTDEHAVSGPGAPDPPGPEPLGRGPFGRSRPQESPWGGDPVAGRAGLTGQAGRVQPRRGSPGASHTVDRSVTDWLAAVESSQLSAGGEHPMPATTPLIRPRSSFAPASSADAPPGDPPAGGASAGLDRPRTAPSSPRIRRQGVDQPDPDVEDPPAGGGRRAVRSRRDEPSAPVIRVTIGRLEVRAPFPAPEPPWHGEPPSEGPPWLDAHLDRPGRDG